MPNGSPVSCSRNRETMILGEVPTRVINPPSREPNDMGIRNTDGDAPDFRAILSADGIRMASAPIFLTSADRTVTEDTNMVSRSEEHTSELQSLMRISYAVFCLKKKKNKERNKTKLIHNE